MEDARIAEWGAVPNLVHGFGRRPETAESREQTRERFARVLAPRADLQVLKQVHGTAIADAPCAGTPEADASLTRDRGLALAIETADCLPVLFVYARSAQIAAAHAGWRGTAAGIAGLVA